MKVRIVLEDGTLAHGWYKPKPLLQLRDLKQELEATDDEISRLQRIRNALQDLVF